MTYQPIELKAGVVIDDYTLIRQLHRGGMATLWLVSHPELAEPALMKVPKLGAHPDPATIVGFEVEQMIMPKLSGSHVPRFIAKGDFTRQPYIVMERLTGESLRSRLDALPLPYDEVREISARVATALHAVHRQHVVHLDLKPSNIMFRPNGDVVLIDFGLSRHELLPDLLAEEFRLPFGTGPYMSPEQVQFVRSDPRSDIFAIGVMIYYMTTGVRPFGEPSSIGGLRKRLFRTPTPPRRLRADYPAWLQEIVLRCLEVDPRKRYQTAAQLAFDLQNPDKVQLTERAIRTRRDGWLTGWRKWFAAVGAEPPPTPTPTEQLARAPIVAVAVDLFGLTPALAQRLRETVTRIVETQPGVRLACLTVLKTHRIAMDETVDNEGRNLHVKRLVALKDWARALQMPTDRITFHVLQAPDPAAAILQYASSNDVDHLILGARGRSAVRRYLGSVSATVVARADCTVTVVRCRGEPRPDEDEIFETIPTD